MKINPLAIYREEFDKSAVLFRPDTGESFMLNRTASFIWKQLEQGADRTEILKKQLEDTNCRIIITTLRWHTVSIMGRQ